MGNFRYFRDPARPSYRMNAGGDGGFEFDELLESELRQRIGVLRGPRPWAGQAAYRAVAATGGKTMPLLSTLAAAASSKAAAGLATAALVVGGGTAAAAVATGSTDPGAWGKMVTEAVTTCKNDLQDGQHGIGQCVSAKASQRGQEHRSSHAASAARQELPASAQSGHPTGKPATHPGAPATIPSGKPSGVPAGPPPSVPPAGGGTHPTGPPVVPPTPRS